MTAGDRVSISRYYGVMVGTVLAVSPGHLTVLTGGARRIIDTSRRQITLLTVSPSSTAVGGIRMR